MRKKLSLFFAFSYLLNSFAFAFAFASQASVHEVYLSQRAYLVVQDFKEGRLDLSKSNLSAEDKMQLELFKNTKDIKINRGDGWITAEYKNMAVVMNFAGDNIYLNGLKLKINPALSMTQNIKNWTIAYNKSKKTSKLENLVRGLISPAQAQVDPVTLGTAASSITSGGLEAFGSNYAIFSSMTAAEAGAATVAGAGGMSAGAVAAVVGGVVVLVTAAVGVTYCEATTYGLTNDLKMRERLNCYAKPLSYFGINPRDKLYMTEISCNGDTIKVRLESDTREEKARGFKYAGDELQAYQNLKHVSSRPFESASISEYPPVVRAELKDKTKITDFDKIREEAAYYRKICKDPALKAQIETAIAQKAGKSQLYKDQPASKGDFNKGAR